MTNNHEIKLAKVGELVLVSGCEKPVPTRNFRILQAEKETKTDMMNPVMQRCSCREYAETAVPEELLRQLDAIAEELRFFGVTAEDIARRFSQVGEAPAEKGERESHD